MWLSFNSETMSDLELTDYADRYLTDTFSTVDGVGRVRLGGQRELSLRIWLDPIALAARDLTTDEVENVLRISRLDNKQLDMRKEYVDMHDILKDAIHHVQLIVDSRQGYIRSKLDALERSVNINVSHFFYIYRLIFLNLIN